MKFKTQGNHRLVYVPQEQPMMGMAFSESAGCKSEITVDGRLVRDVLDYERFYVVIEFDGRTRTWSK